MVSLEVSVCYENQWLQYKKSILAMEFRSVVGIEIQSLLLKVNGCCCYKIDGCYGKQTVASVSQ
jgi:hypothetical protein